MTWNHKAGQKDTSYSGDFFLSAFFFFFSPSFLLNISCYQRQDSCMGESLISTSVVAAGQLNNRRAAMGIELDILDFRNLISSVNIGRKRIQRSEKKKERDEIHGGFFWLFKNLKKKKMYENFRSEV